MTIRRFLPEHPWPRGTAYPSPAYPRPADVEIVDSPGGPALEWGDEATDGPVHRGGDRIMRDVAALARADDRRGVLRFVERYGVPRLCFTHGAAWAHAGTFSDCRPWRPFPVAALVDAARGFAGLWRLFAELRVYADDRRVTRPEDWRDLRALPEGYVEMFGRLAKVDEIEIEGPTPGDLEEWIRGHPARAHRILESTLYRRLNKYGVSWAIAGGISTSDSGAVPEGIRPVPRLPNAFAAAYFKFLLRVSGVGKANVCAYCGDVFKPKRVDRTRCYAPECRRAWERDRKKRRRAARDP